jgi:hypothetical protein
MKNTILFLLFIMLFQSIVFSQTCPAPVVPPADLVNVVVNSGFETGVIAPGNAGPQVLVTCCSSPGKYMISGLSNNFNTGIIQGITPHSGSQMLMIDGVMASNAIAWEQIVTVQPNKMYYFSAWLTAISSVEKSQMVFQIQPLAPVAGASVNISSYFIPPNGPTWQQQFGTWFSGTTTSVTIRLINTNPLALGGNGNDYAIDDIMFRPTCVGTTAGPKPNMGADVQGICNGGGQVNLNANVPNQASNTYTWFCNGAVVPNVTTPNILEAQATIGTYVVCVDSAGCVKSDTVQLQAALDTCSSNTPFGKGFWNVYCYNGNMVLNPTKTIYAGYYTENNFSFDSRKRYPYANDSRAVPSNANSASGNAYIGNTVGKVHTIIYKRAGFPAGYYQLDVPALDDIGYLTINGVAVWNYQVCCQSHPNVWRGKLDSTSTIEFKYINMSSGSSLVLNAQIVPNIDLPVAFIDFKAHKEGAGVQLEWVTASESNNDFFTVEKSSDGINFEPVTTVKGAGNSTSIATYKATDGQLSSGVSYYRIKQTDFNQSSSYSAVLCFSYNPATGLAVCPNPGTSNEAMFVTLPSENSQVLIVVRDMQGQEYYSKVVLDTESHTLVAINPEPPLAPGMYTIIASSNDEIFSQKIIVK